MAIRCEPFFLPAGSGRRFCLVWRPQGEPVGGVLYLHPFAEEMNKSRRAVANQARALAESGWLVLQIDLFGCGDSDGAIGQAHWATWRADVDAALDWMSGQGIVRPWLWGLRLGASLAADVAALRPNAFAALLLWQPVINGNSFLTQFLRLRLASEMLGAAGQSGGTNELRAALAADETLEIAGYEISPRLARDLDGLKLAPLDLGRLPVHWLEVAGKPGAEPGFAARQVLDAWQARGASVDARVVAGDAFWATQEITECPDLQAASLEIMNGAAR